MEKINLSNNLKVSRLVHGHWRLTDWKMSDQELLSLTQQAIELGITTFDQADIYGNYGCEEVFGNALSLKKGIRQEIQIITKCGIKLISDKFPDRKIKYYDYSSEYIISSVERSLENLRTDYIDLLLLHRPSPFFNPEEVAAAFERLKKAGKVLHLGVSNFEPQQYEMLNSYLNGSLATNQVEISPFCLDNFSNGNMDYFLTKRIKPLAWSPLSGGKIFSPESERELRIYKSLKDVAAELGVEHLDKIVYSWLYMHPASIIPIAGTGNIVRLKQAVEALNIRMSLEQWFKIYIASRGEELP